MKLVGITPADFLTRVHMVLAQRLLRQGRPVALVADAAGYGSQPAISRFHPRDLHKPLGLGADACGSGP